MISRIRRWRNTKEKLLRRHERKRRWRRAVSKARPWPVYMKCFGPGGVTYARFPNGWRAREELDFLNKGPFDHHQRRCSGKAYRNWLRSQEKED